MIYNKKLDKIDSHNRAIHYFLATYKDENDIDETRTEMLYASSSYQKHWKYIAEQYRNSETEQVIEMEELYPEEFALWLTKGEQNINEIPAEYILKYIIYLDRPTKTKPITGKLSRYRELLIERDSNLLEQIETSYKEIL